MRFKKDSWVNMCSRIQRGRVLLEKYRENPESTLLDMAVLACCWPFGEYAIHVVLELVGEKPVKNHSQPVRARDLHQLGTLQVDYHDPLERLNRFRKKASYVDYAKSPSIHYHATDIENCLTALEHLRDEVEAMLRGQGKI